jgi:hypothetical protein
MTTLPTIARLGRGATLALILAAPTLSAAYAFDPFGGDESLVRNSAQSARYADPADTPLARATADARMYASPLAANAGARASNAPLGGGLHDLLGQGGPQDELARAIHHPGSGTDW